MQSDKSLIAVDNLGYFKFSNSVIIYLCFCEFENVNFENKVYFVDLTSRFIYFAQNEFILR